MEVTALSAWVFWGSLALIAYVYLGYPILLAFWSRLAARRGARRAAAAGPRDWPPGKTAAPLPPISIIVVARNEASRLPQRIDNLLSLEYPAPREIIVVSDGSSDDTPGVLARYGSRVQVAMLPARGKWAALNHGVTLARYDTFVFADARQVFAPDALLQLVRPLADPAIGAVSGELVLDAEAGERRRRQDRRAGERAGAFDRRLNPRSVVADGMGLYWRYEKALRKMESTVGSTLGTTGAIWAVRRALWQPLPPDTILDDVLAPMRVVLRGRRVVFQEAARAYDRVSDTPEVEARRKIRTLAGNVQILWLEPRLLVPLVNPVWLQYVSHKLGRLVVPYAMVALFLSNLWLAPGHVLYAAALAGQIAFYLLAAYGAYLDRTQLEARPTGDSRTPVDAGGAWGRPADERPVI